MPSKIKRRGPNSYLLTVAAGYNTDGSQKTFTKTIHVDTLTEAKQQYSLFAAECLQGKMILAGTEKMTLAQFYEYWKHHHGEKNLQKTTTYYNDNLSTRIIGALGHLKIDKVAPRHILEFIDQLGAPDAGHGNKPLSTNTVRKHYTLLKTLFNAAVQWSFISSNPLEKVQPPKQQKVRKQILNEDQMTAFLDCLDNHKNKKHRLWVLLAFSIGLRREEIFGLKWGNITDNTITIEQAAVYVPGSGVIIKDTKSDNSFRTLSLPPDIVELFKIWKDEVKAAAKRKANRTKVIILDDATAPDKWIFPQANGTVGHPHSFNNFMKRFVVDNGLSNVSPHLLRHMTGSYLLKSGLDIAAVSAKLGHGQKSFTLNTYIHELQSCEEHSADIMQNILDDFKNRGKKEKGQAINPSSVNAHY